MAESKIDELQRITEELGLYDEELGGKKYDDGKPMIQLVPSEFVLATARAFTFGANKYGGRNWEKGIEYDRLFGSLMRHLWAYHGGQPNDDESGLSHLDHAAACLAMIVALKERS